MSKKSSERWRNPSDLKYVGQTNFYAARVIKNKIGDDVVLSRRPHGLISIMATKEVYDDVSDAVLLANRRETHSA